MYSWNMTLIFHPLNVNQLLLEIRRDFVVEDEKRKFTPEKTLKGDNYTVLCYSYTYLVGSCIM